MSNRLDAMVARENNGKTYWTRIGAAFESRNGGWTVRLDATPLDGVIHLMKPLPKRDASERGGDGGSTREQGDYGQGEDNAPF